jgi:tetratricopeptide (TPR) repeat protein
VVEFGMRWSSADQHSILHRRAFPGHGSGRPWIWILLLLALLCLWLAAGTVFSPGAAADQRDKRLPDLFTQLQGAKSPSEAHVIESVIWAIWAETGDKDLDHLLGEGANAMSVQDYTTALSDFDELTKRAPQFAEGWNKRATVLYLMGDLQASLSDIDRVLKLEPRHFGALSGLGLVNIGLEHDEAARDAFQRVLKIDPMNPGAKANLKAIQDEIDNKSI